MPTASSVEPVPGPPAPGAEQPRLALHGISKRYGGVRAIRNADMTVGVGQVHALVGENGAGKSTLIKIISGAEAADTGGIEFEGSPVSINSTQDAMALGVATVYQEPQLFAELTVSENIFLGREVRRGGRIDWAEQNRQVVELLALLGLPERISTVAVGELSIATQQQVSIAKALVGNAKILILDEPSAILTDNEIDVLFGVVRRLAAGGVSVIYISHRLDELFRIADAVTVMRDGETIGSYPIADLSVRKIAELMVGGILSDERVERNIPDGEPMLVLSELGLRGQFHDVNVTVKPGEIVGLYGLVGSGVSEIADTLYGIERYTDGAVLLAGKQVRPRSPRQAGKLGIALLPANRKLQGMFGFQSIAFNISIGHLPRLSYGDVFVDRAKEKETALALIKRLAIKTPSERTPIGAMSGGNAQKVVLARQLVAQPKVMVLAEPTQGVDVGAKEEIHRIITELAENGVAVLVVTSDLSEALRIADRLQVIRAGTVVAEFGPGATQVDVLSAAAGAIDEAVARSATTGADTATDTGTDPDPETDTDIENGGGR
ncbi:sugar ABC transporter ATP-binding protein [Nakamurella lactea]|uniref:sugar ABC transporter ATP-binding protein n=1 Tax=Nakamurella lactea TaxID=459515 RepID=UPI0004235444|nr:sugar ABC transporter ATP-binding protein [Nakamurella lactea]